MQLLWPLFRHTLTDVRLHVAHCCRHMASAVFACGDESLAAASGEGWVRPMVRLALQSLLTSGSPMVCSACEQLLEALAAECPAATLAVALDAQAMQILAALPCMSVSAPLQAGYLLDPAPAGEEAAANSEGRPHKAARTAAAAATDSYIADEGSSAEATARRIRYARFFARVAEVFRQAQGGADVALALSNVQNLMGTYLLGQSGEAQSFGALVFLFWMLPMSEPSSCLPDSVRQQVCPAFHAVLPCSGAPCCKCLPQKTGICANSSQGESLASSPCISEGLWIPVHLMIHCACRCSALCSKRRRSP
jgi:hypothetical protein